MSAKIFSLAANSRKVIQPSEFTLREKDGLFKLGVHGVLKGAIGDYLFGTSRQGHPTFILKACMPHADDIVFTKSPEGYTYFRDNENCCNAHDFRTALNFAREDLSVYGPEIQHEKQRAVRERSISSRRDSFQVVPK